MEYEKIDKGGKTVKWHVDEYTKVPQQVWYIRSGLWLQTKKPTDWMSLCHEHINFDTIFSYF
jgi:hypothetical protein